MNEYEPYTHNEWDISFCMRRDCARVDCKRHKDGKNYQDMLMRAGIDSWHTEMAFDDCISYMKKATCN